MATGITAPTSAPAGFPFAEITKVFRKRCHVYFTTGHWLDTDDNYPTSKATNLALYDNGPFFPLGAMDEGVGSIKTKRNSFKIDFYTIPTDAEITLELNNVRVYPDMLTWLDTDEAKGELTLLFVPDGDDGSTFLALNGVGVTPEGEISLGGQLSKIKLSNSKLANDITDVVKYAIFSS